MEEVEKKSTFFLLQEGKDQNYDEVESDFIKELALTIDKTSNSVKAY
ncbi:hypothetical protein QQA45_06075 [Sneathia sanguinegens]|uniref:Uncharacterized protein n=1 Tax=Sneathia sanguinegens TaxID=40543 RepID=A0ABT7HKK0_9FUSO|nr:hypothetical protein [Sneathia sanguinegens]MDK9581060.1 hypothetical protein [Sneathia sanguinegens]